MKRTGKVRIQKNRNGEKPSVCANCGGKGRFRVTFEDNFGKVIITLCEVCATKQYEELKLQSRFDWPIEV